MKSIHRLSTITALLMLLACGVAGAAEPTQTGMTMRVQQEMTLGDLSCTTDYRASFLPNGRFRAEGTMTMTRLEMVIKTTTVSDGAIARQLTESPLTGVKAIVIDLQRIRKALPEGNYSPSKTYDPSVYSELLKNNPDYRTLPKETLDGAEMAGAELDLPAGRLSLSANVSAALPEPAKVRVWLHPADGIARKVEMLDAKGQLFLRMFFTDVRTGVPIPAETFELKFPKGVQPQDMTGMVMTFVAGNRAQAQQQK